MRRLLPLLPLLAGLAGCFEMDVRLEADGSGTARLALDVPAGPGEASPDIDRAIGNGFTAPGVDVRRVRHLDVLDRRKVWLELSFDDVTALAQAPVLAGLELAWDHGDDRALLRGSYQPRDPAGVAAAPFRDQPVRIGIEMPGLVRRASGAFDPASRAVSWSTTVGALAAAPLSLEAESGTELAPPGPGSLALALAALLGAIATIGVVRSCRGNREMHAFLAVGGLVTLSFEVVLTRLFSAVLWYHFAFMAISIALLGQGAGASVVTALGPRAPGRTDAAGIRRGAGRLMLMTALGVVATLCYLVRFTSTAASTSWGFALLFLLAASPFFFYGAGVARIFQEEAAPAGTLYFANLAGAAAGTLAAIPLLTWLGADTALLAVALLACAAAMSLSRGLTKAVALAGILVLIGLVATNRPDGPLMLRGGKGGSAKTVYLGLWNSFSYITVGPEFSSSWGLSRDYRGGHARSLGLEIDLNAFTPIIRYQGDAAAVAEVSADVTAVVHRLGPGRDVLVIGPGGGKDVLAALLGGARHVTAVEINPLIATLVRDRFRGFSGGLYRDDRVELRVENGRAYVDTTEATFDVIQASLVDTWAASASGAFTLSENHLYTQEAVVAYLARLSPGGMLSVSRWHHDPPRESLRLLSLCSTALEASGSVAPLRHIAVLFGGSVATFLVAREPLTQVQRTAIERAAADGGFALAFGGDPAPAEGDLLRKALASGMGAVSADAPWDLSAPRDERPFFFHTVRGRDYLSIPWRAVTHQAQLIEEINAQAVWVVLRLLWITTAAAGILIFGPLLLARRRLGQLSFGVPLAYFALLGLAFVFVVSGNVGRLSVRFGNPTLAFVTTTFATLLGASIGAALSNLLERAPRAVLLAVPAGVATFSIVMASSSLRAPLVLATLMGLQGLLLGIPFPRGLELVRGSGMVPWAFATNGALSVVGGSLSLVLALLFGYTVLIGAGVALYGLACLCYLRIPSEA